VAPTAGTLSDRIGGRPLLASGLLLQVIGLGWLALAASPTVPYLDLVPAFVVSGENNAIRELGGVFGIAVLGAVFSARGGYAPAASFVAGLTPAVWAGAAGVAVAAVLIPAALGRSWEAVVKRALEEAEQRVAEPDLVG
jgi:MFS family permease